MDWTTWENYLFNAPYKFPFGAGQLSGDARIAGAGGIGGAGKRLEQSLNDVVRFVAVKQFQMQVAAGFVGEALEKFAGEAEAECAGDILVSFGLGNFLVRKLVQPRQTRYGRPLKSMTQRARHSSIGT